MIPPILAQRSAAGFWLAVLLTGAGTGLAAAALTGLLELLHAASSSAAATPATALVTGLSADKACARAPSSPGT